jgi:transcriptional regulator with XRE-family HTH domain
MALSTGELLALCRELKGFALKEVAAETGLSLSYVSHLEHHAGQRLSFRAAILLCRCYGLSLEKLAATVDLHGPAEEEHV